jgi:hypothetical protein
MRLFQPCRRPWLVFNAPPATGGTVDRSTLTPEDFLTQFGFPKDTATDDMTDAQKAAYWRDKSKGFQRDSEAKDRELSQWKGLGEFDAVSTTVTTAEQERQKNLTDAQRAQEEAQRAEQAARTAGEAVARQKFLGTAVRSSLVALTRGPNETPEDAAKRVNGALEFVDVARFLNDQGDLDESRLGTFAESIGAPSAGAGAPGDPLHVIMQRQSAPPAGSSGSVADARARTKERLSKKQ